MIRTEAFRDYLSSKSFLQPLGLKDAAGLEFSELGCGEYNANYLFIHPVTGQKLVLRVNTGSQMHLTEQVKYEFSALKNLQCSGRTPKALFYDETKDKIPYGILVMEWLPGRALRYETDLNKAAEILADIHSVPIPADCSLICPEAPALAIYEECQSMAEHYFSWDSANLEVCRLLEKMFDEIGRLPLSAASAAPKCIVNTELNSGNFLINEEGRSFLVDWEKPLISEPAQDLGHFLVPTTTFWKTDVILTPEEIRYFVKTYKNAVAGRLDVSSINERLPLYFTVTCLRGVTWCAMAMREYSKEDRVLVNADTLAKLHDYLSIDFLQNLLNNYILRDFLKED